MEQAKRTDNNPQARGEALFHLSQLSGAVGLRRLSSASDLTVGTVCIDSRQAGPASLFIALKGEKADGHDFVKAAFASGCRCALVSEAGYRARETEFSLLSGQGMEFLIAADSLAGFQSLAAWYLRLFPNLIRVGVTGSSGKTTSKEMIAAIASRRFSVVCNEGNFNSETGLPLSVFRVRSHHQLGVFELGMNHRGEMDGIVPILSPGLALITNIGTAHIGILGSQDAIAEEKRKIFSLFDGSQSAFIPEGDAYFDYLSRGLKGRVISYGPQSTPGFRGSQSLGLDGSAIDWEGSRVVLPLPGAHNVRNALGAMALTRELGCGLEDFSEGLASMRAFFGRGEVLRGKLTVFQDCYNANLESLGAAIDFCDSVEWGGGRKVYLLGSILELGDSSQAIHAQAGKLAAGSKADALFLFGSEMEAAYEAAVTSGFSGHMVWSDKAQDLSQELAAYLAGGDLVLVKGSRGMQMERFSQEILA